MFISIAVLTLFKNYVSDTTSVRKGSETGADGAWGGDGVGQITATGTRQGVLWGQLQAVAGKTLTCQGGVGKRQEGALGRN